MTMHRMSAHAQPLPIDFGAAELTACLAPQSAAVLVAPPGAGKTTRVPLVLAKEPWTQGKTILVLEPRRLAARVAAARMAATLGEPVAQPLGSPDPLHLQSLTGDAHRSRDRRRLHASRARRSLPRGHRRRSVRRVPRARPRRRSRPSACTRRAAGLARRSRSSWSCRPPSKARASASSWAARR